MKNYNVMKVAGSKKDKDVLVVVCVEPGEAAYTACKLMLVAALGEGEMTPSDRFYIDVVEADAEQKETP